MRRPYRPLDATENWRHRRFLQIRTLPVPLPAPDSFVCPVPCFSDLVFDWILAFG